MKLTMLETAPETPVKDPMFEIIGVGTFSFGILG